LDNLMTDTDIGFIEGNIDTTDYEFSIGLDTTGGLYYSDILDAINQANNWDISAWNDRAFYFQPKESEISYVAEVDDGEVDLNFGLEQIETRLYVSYTANGNDYRYFWYGPEGDAESLYRRRDGVLAIQGTASKAYAEHVAGIVLAERQRMRPATSFRVNRLYDAESGIEVNPALARSGKIIHIANLYPTETRINAKRMINELSTFEICEISYDATTGKPTISPGVLGLRSDKILARIEARTR
jgi:hypothetical protein